jgi:hypothetical protein
MASDLLCNDDRTVTWRSQAVLQDSWQHEPSGTGRMAACGGILSTERSPKAMADRMKKMEIISSEWLASQRWRAPPLTMDWRLRCDRR